MFGQYYKTQKLVSKSIVYSHADETNGFFLNNRLCLSYYEQIFYIAHHLFLNKLKILSLTFTLKKERHL